MADEARPAKMKLKNDYSFILFGCFLRSSSHALLPKRLESQTTPHKIEMTWGKNKRHETARIRLHFTSFLFGQAKKKYGDCIANVSLSVTPCRCPRLALGSLHNNRLNSIQTHDFSISFLHQTEIHQSQSQKNISFFSFVFGLHLFAVRKLYFQTDR